MIRLTRVGRPNSQARTGTGKYSFSMSSADHEQDWQPCVDLLCSMLYAMLPILLVAVSWTGKINIFLSSPFAPETLASRDGFGRPVPRQPAHSPHSGWIWFLWAHLGPDPTLTKTLTNSNPHTPFPHSPADRQLHNVVSRPWLVVWMMDIDESRGIMHCSIRTVYSSAIAPALIFLQPPFRRYMFYVDQLPASPSHFTKGGLPFSQVPQALLLCP